MRYVAGGTLVAIPMEALSDPLLTNVQFRMLCLLCSFCPAGKSECYPSIAMLAECMGLADVTQVCRITRALEVKGWIDKRSKASWRGTKVYKIRVPLRLRGVAR